MNVTEGNRPIGNANRVENTENRQTRNAAPARENVNNNTMRESGNRQPTTTQPTREQRTQVSTPVSTPRTENTGRTQTIKEEVKQADKKSIEGSEKRETGSPNRR